VALHIARTHILHNGGYVLCHNHNIAAGARERHGVEEPRHDIPHARAIDGRKQLIKAVEFSRV
jgi:hypothetical protein